MRAGDHGRDPSPVFVLRNVSFVYPGGREALRDVSLEVMEGEILGIVGPNGAGKSTLLLLMDALLTPTEGEIYFRGTKINDRIRDKKFMYDFRRRVALVFQDPDVQLFSSTVRKDLEFGPRHLNVDEDEVRRRVEEALRVFGIEHLADRHPYDLSYGEKRKAAVATIHPMDPEVMLLDEPTSNLDLRSRRELIELIKRLNQEGKTVVVSSHDLDFILEIAHRVCLLNRSVVAVGDPRNILSNRELLHRNNLEVPKTLEIENLRRMLGESSLIRDV